MQTAESYLTDVTVHTQHALERMPIRSSLMAQQMVKAGLPVPETHQDIERYVQSLLIGESNADKASQ